MPQRDSLDVDVLFVGGGPASLAGAIRLQQLAKAASVELAVMVIEKGGEIGNHGFSGAVVDPKALHELFPNEDVTGGLDTPVSSDAMWFLTNGGKTSTPASSAFAASHLVRFESEATYLPWLLSTGGTNGALIFPPLVRNHIASLDTGVSSPPVTSSLGKSSCSAFGSTTAPEKPWFPISQPFSITITASSTLAAFASCCRRIAPASEAGPPPTNRTSTSRESRCGMTRRDSRRDPDAPGALRQAQADEVRVAVTATRCAAMRSSHGRGRGLSKVSAAAAPRYISAIELGRPGKTRSSRS